jgi:GNAT superfamily N-acetyltransferase
MAYRGRGEREVDSAPVEETTREELLPFREAIARTEPWAEDDEVVREVLAAGELWQRTGVARYFAVRVDGVPVAGAELYSDGRIAQIEDVATLPAYRGRGYASAAVQRAVEEALAAGHELVFIVADDGEALRPARVRGDRAHVELPQEARSGFPGLNSATSPSTSNQPTIASCGGFSVP